MSDRHLPFWPPHAPRHLWVPETHLYRNVEVAAMRFPRKPLAVFYDSVLRYGRFHDETERLAGFLQHACGVRRGERVLLAMQNSPQFMIACYAILRADAVVVPVNPMCLTAELEHLARDSGARVAFAAQDLLPPLRPLLGRELDHLVVATYSDYLEAPSTLPVPDFVSAPRLPLAEADCAAGAVAWADALAAGHRPGALEGGPDDLAVMPYTSGTTGSPKGCMHSHRSTMYNAVAGSVWHRVDQGSVGLAALPMFHVTGMQANLHVVLYAASSVVLLPRWDRDAAAACVQRHRVTALPLITAMVVDFLAHPRLADYDLSSLRRLSGGGAAMPRAVALAAEQRLGLKYCEGYGLSEAMAATHLNPPERPKEQCLGLPIFDVDARVVDPATLRELAPGEVGEIVVHGPQVMQGYWRRPEADAEAFVQIDGKRFLRTGDLARVDDEGYFFFVDRLKRMINVAGYKVWPAEVEALLYRHPDIQEACVIAAPDAHRGETVKAVVVLKPGSAGRVAEAAIVDWARQQMAAYKVPRIVQFTVALPRSGSGKLMWRALQEAEWAAAAQLKAQEPGPPG